MKLPKEQLVKDKLWQIAYRWRLTLRGKPVDGLCEYKTRTIWIDRSLDEQAKSAAFLHEFLHALLWEHDLGHNASKNAISLELEEQIVSAIETELLASYKLRLLK
jgi:hypothetical protein